MLPPRCRVLSIDRWMLAWFKAMANDRFGAAIAYEPSQGFAVVSSVRNAEETCGP